MMKKIHTRGSESWKFQSTITTAHSASRNSSISAASQNRIEYWTHTTSSAARSEWLFRPGHSQSYRAVSEVLSRRRVMITGGLGSSDSNLARQLVELAPT